MRKIFALCFLLGAAGLANAVTLQESTFKAMGYSDFYIKDSNVFSCNTYTLPFPADTNADVLGVVSLKVFYLPGPSGAPTLKAYLNDNFISEYFPSDFKDGALRVVLPRDKMGVSNSFRLCGMAAPQNTIWVSEDSAYGLYRMPYFPKGAGLAVQLETYHPIVGVPFEIVAVAKNYGGEDVQVSLSYRRVDLKESLPEASVLDGETSKSGVVKMCERWDGAECTMPGELRIAYKAVANKAVPMTLLPAVMVYNDAFGKAMAVSNRPDIGALDSNRVSAQILLENDSIYAGEKIPIKIVVRNSGTPAEGVEVKIRSGLEAIGGEEKSIPRLAEGETQVLQFEAKGARAGNYELGCSFKYEGREFECQSTNIRLESQLLTPELMGAALLTFLGLGVFAYFYYLKKDEA